MRFNICDDKYYIFSNKGLELKSITGKEIKTEKTKFISNFVPIIDKKLLVEGKDNSPTQRPEITVMKFLDIFNLL